MVVLKLNLNLLNQKSYFITVVFLCILKQINVALSIRDLFLKYYINDFTGLKLLNGSVVHFMR